MISCQRIEFAHPLVRHQFNPARPEFRLGLSWPMGLPAVESQRQTFVPETGRDRVAFAPEGRLVAAGDAFRHSVGVG